MPAKFREAATQLRLKDDDKRARQNHREAADNPADDDQVQQLRDQRQREENDREAGQHFRAARSFEVKVAVVNADAQQNDLEKAAPFIEPELDERLDHLAVARNASV